MLSARLCCTKEQETRRVPNEHRHQSQPPIWRIIPSEACFFSSIGRIQQITSSLPVTSSVASGSAPKLRHTRHLHVNKRLRHALLLGPKPFGYKRWWCFLTSSGLLHQARHRRGKRPTPAGEIQPKSVGACASASPPNLDNTSTACWLRKTQQPQPPIVVQGQQESRLFHCRISIGTSKLCHLLF